MNDSLNLATAKRPGIQSMATADQSFDTVQGIIVNRATDIAYPQEKWGCFEPEFQPTGGQRPRALLEKPVLDKPWNQETGRAQ
jgi:hypothetical protein